MKNNVNIIRQVSPSINQPQIPNKLQRPLPYQIKQLTIVAKVTDMKTSDSLLRLISKAVASAVGTTVKGKSMWGHYFIETL